MDKYKKSFMFGYVTEMVKYGHFSRVQKLVDNELLDQLTIASAKDDELVLSGRLQAVQELANESLRQLNILMSQLEHITKHRQEPESKAGICILCSMRAAVKTFGNLCERCAQMNLFNNRLNEGQG